MKTFQSFTDDEIWCKVSWENINMYLGSDRQCMDALT